jgi:acetyltransferase
MNPVLIQNGIPLIVDTRIFVSPSAAVSPMHLVISPYPSEYEFHLQAEENIRIFVRAVKPEDALLFQELFQQLSPTSIYYRFFGAIRTLAPEMLSRFTQIDYDREIALVALDDNTESEKLLGVARIIGDPDGIEGEFAVMVGDAWQGKGIGSRLLQRCLLLAAKRGFKKVHGVVLKGNTKMLALGKKLGFAMRWDVTTGEYELHIDLDRQLVDELEQLADG